MYRKPKKLQSNVFNPYLPKHPNFSWGVLFLLVRPTGRTAGGESPLFQPDVGQEVATQQGRLGNKGSEGS